MAEEHKPIDISGIPELLRIVEEVRLSRRPRVLRRDREDVAVVVPMPAKSRRTRRAPTPEDRAATLAAAGGWKDLVDANELKEQLAAARGSNRPPASL